MSININELNNVYRKLIKINPELASTVKTYIGIINEYGCDAIIKNGEEKLISGITQLIKNAIKIEETNYKTAKAIKKMFKENIITNDKEILFLLSKANKCFDSMEDLHIKMSKAFGSTINVLNEYYSYSYSNKKKFLNAFRETAGPSIIYYANNYVNFLNISVESYNKCINRMSSNKVTSPIKTHVQTNEWQIINKHGFSVNKMYTSVSDKIVRSTDYNKWISDMLYAMKTNNFKSLENMGVNPNKPMKIEVEFKLVKGCDTDNPLKSFIDLLVRYYKLPDDNNFVNINVSRNPEWAKSYSDGQIKFKIENI